MLRVPSYSGPGGVLQLSISPAHPALPQYVVARLRDGIATCKSSHGLSLEARGVIAEVCNLARDGRWTPEQLIVAVKEACYSSPEIAMLTTASEREAMMATIVTGCICEYYTPRGD
jgi:hypothetical protein